MNEELSSKFLSTTAQREALERERDSADPDRRASLDAQLVGVRNQEAIMRSQLGELNGFSGAVPVIPVHQSEPAKEQQVSQPQEPKTVFQKEVTSGSRVTGVLGAINAERMIETQVHPDIIEARLANQRQEQIREQIATEKNERDAEKDRQAEIRAKDVERTERIFEGGHTLGDLTTKEYLQMESSHRNSIVEQAEQAVEHEAQQAAEVVAVAELSEETGVPHVILAADVLIEGEIVAETIVRDESYFAVEFFDAEGQSTRALVPAAGAFTVGDSVQVARKLQYQIEPSFDYGR